MILILVLLFGVLAMLLLGGDWRSGLLLTIVIGFAQDPIRKLTPGQPGLYVGLVLVAFLASALVLWQQNGGRFDFTQMFVTSPRLSTWLSFLVLLVLLQAMNGLLLWDVPTRVVIGVGFYLAPLLGLWMGFQLGKNQFLLRRLLYLYLICASVFAFTALLDYRGLKLPIFQAIGGGQLIHFRYGFFTTGATGLWRSTDLAAMHLTIAACLSLCFGFSESNILRRNLWFLAVASFGTISLLTGRRKAIVQILFFAGIFLFLVSRYGSRTSRSQIFAILVTASSLSALMFLLDPSEFLGDDFGEYISRAESAPSGLWARFNLLGLAAFQRGLEISNGFGIGVGTLAQTGAANIGGISGEGYAYVSESGIGKVAAELGIPGIILLAIVSFGFLQLIRKNLRLLLRLPRTTSILQSGLLAFSLSNLPFFSSAAGVYGDPFILIMCGLSFGCFLAVPQLVIEYSSRNTPHPCHVNL